MGNIHTFLPMYPTAREGAGGKVVPELAIT